MAALNVSAAGENDEHVIRFFDERYFAIIDTTQFMQRRKR